MERASLLAYGWQPRSEAFHRAEIKGARDAPLGRHMRPVLASILNIPLFLIGNLLLGKLGETVIIHGYALHNGPRESSGRQPASFLCTKAPMITFWMAFQDLKAESTPKD